MQMGHVFVFGEVADESS